MSVHAERREGRSRAGPRQSPSFVGTHAEAAKSLLDAIADGELDDHLQALAQAIDARIGLVHTVRSIDALAQLCVGDHVRINQHARPRYLHGIHGTIIDVDSSTATIDVGTPVGRFRSGKIRCPPLALNKLASTN